MSELLENSNISVDNIITEELKDKITDQFDIDDIGKINLNEALEIANEEILILTEKDFLNDLDNIKFDLKPEPLRSNLSVAEEAEEADVAIDAVGAPDNSDLDLINSEVDEQVECEDNITDSEENIFELTDDDLSDIENLAESDILSDDIDDLSSEEIKESEPQNQSFLVSEAVNQEETEHTEEYKMGEAVFVEKEDGSEEYFLEDDNIDEEDNILFVDDEELGGELTDLANDESDISLLGKKTSANKKEENIYGSDYRDLESVPSKLKSFKDTKPIKEVSQVVFDDSDINFIDNSIIRDDFGRYILEIDEYDNGQKSHKSKVDELYGIENDELIEIEESMYQAEFQNQQIDNTDRVLDFFEQSFSGQKNTKFIVNDKYEFDTSDIESIEEDITSKNALVIEEDVDEIEKVYDKKYGNDLDKTIDNDKSEIDVQSSTDESQLFDANEDIIVDITDRVVILEDYNERETFTNKFPEKKDDLNKLFTYLDGLFEKLPEEVIMKFADSEYFDLYMKVINDME